MEVNHFNIACCDPSLGNHYFNGYSFANAADVETYFGMTTGDVTFFNTNIFKTIVPYDVESDGTGSLLSNSVYKDYWGIIRDFVQSGSSTPRTDIELYAHNVRNIEQNTFSQVDNSRLIFKNIDNLGTLPADTIFGACDNIYIGIDTLNKLSSHSFASITNSVIRLGSAIGAKTSGDIYGATTNNLFFGSSGVTIYCSTDFASSDIMVNSLVANPLITLITY